MATASTAGDSSPNESQDRVQKLLQHHLLLAVELQERCDKNQHIQGAKKLKKKCQAEHKFLQGLRGASRRVQETHLRSSNLTHLHGIVGAMEALPQVTTVQQPFQCQGLGHSMVVDVICNQGYTWVKVIARNAQALHLVWAGGGQFGDRSIVDQAEQFVSCARQHPLHFQTPQVLFQFINGITAGLKEALEAVGVVVQGEIQEVDANTKEQVEIVKEIVRSNEDDEDGSDGDEDAQISVPKLEMEKSLSASTSSGVMEMDSQGLKLGSQTSPSSNAHESVNKQHLSCDTDSLSLQHSYQDDSGTKPVLYVTDGCGNSDSQIVTDFASFFSELKLSTGSKTLDDTCDTAIYASSKIHQNKSVSCESHTKRSDHDDESTHGGADATKGTSLEGLLLSKQPQISSLNLDITTLISLVSNLCHGRCHYVFEEDILTQQAKEEQENPLLPRLAKLFEGKELLACHTAVDGFMSVLGVVGGPEEKKRADKLMSMVKVIPDCPSERTNGLLTSAKVKKRAKVIFGTGDSVQAVTVSANVGFVRGTEDQGVSYAVFLHESRALTEQKEVSAKEVGPHNLI